MRAKDRLGRDGEDLAADHLRRAGLAILDRNWRCAAGEIDIVARDGSALVVCEVKTRSSTSYGWPAEAVTPRKLRRLRELALRWLDERQIYVPEIRFDVISIMRPPHGRPTLEHLRGVQ